MDDEIPEHGDSHASFSHEVSLEPTFKRREDLGKHNVYTHFPYVNTTPQMTCFRGAKVCAKWLQGKSDDELIQLDNKMRIWTRSGKFRKVENPELSMGW